LIQVKPIDETRLNSLTALAALAIAATFVRAASFAARFTVRQGKRHRGILALKSVEQSLIAQKFRDLGFSGFRCTSDAPGHQRKYAT
jgi:hypothetical protein